MINIFDKSSIEEWKQKFNKLPKKVQDIYYHPDYYKIYDENNEGEMECFCFSRGDDLVLYPYLRKQIASNLHKLGSVYFDIEGAYGYNGVASTTMEINFIESFYIAFHEFALSTRIVSEFTRFNPITENYKFSRKHLNIEFNRKTVLLNLDTFLDNIWIKSFSSSNRNMIRKAIKNNIRVVRSDDFETFWALYLGTMKTVLAIEYYFFNKTYFENLSKTLKNNIELYYAKFENKIVAGAIIIYSEDYAHYYLSARDNDYSSYAPTNLILYEAIRKAQERGCKIFHFGGGRSNDSNDTLFKFKSEFSKEYPNFYTGKAIHNKELYDQITEQWKIMYPDIEGKYNNILLKHHYIN